MCALTARALTQPKYDSFSFSFHFISGVHSLEGVHRHGVANQEDALRHLVAHLRPRVQLGDHSRRAADGQCTVVAVVVCSATTDTKTD